MQLPKLELDSEQFTILAQNEGLALAQHKESGRFWIWRLAWKSSTADGRFNADDAGQAWAQYMKEVTK